MNSLHSHMSLEVSKSFPFTAHCWSAFCSSASRPPNCYTSWCSQWVWSSPFVMLVVPFAFLNGPLFKWATCGSHGWWVGLFYVCMFISFIQGFKTRCNGTERFGPLHLIMEQYWRYGMAVTTVFSKNQLNLRGCNGVTERNGMAVTDTVT
jgi:hypothetical protein